MGARLIHIRMHFYEIRTDFKRLDYLRNDAFIGEMEFMINKP